MNLIRLTRLFFKGLERNFKIIRYGDVPAVYNNPVLLERYAFADGSFRAYVLSIRELAKHLLRRSVKIYSIPDSGVMFCGGSSNNEREFEFFTRIMNDQVSCTRYEQALNLSFVDAAEKSKLISDKLLSIIFFLFCVCYLSRIKLGPISLKYLIAYSKIFLQVVSSYQRYPLRTRLMVVANDHTDFPVATAMVMQYYRVPVVYLQHAEVSSSFPPLDFDISILRNEKSLEKYAEIGKVRGDVFIVPRAMSSNIQRVFQARAQEQVAVVLYLSSVYKFAEVQKCILALLSNKNVSMVGIKPHPRADIEPLKGLEGVSIYSCIPEFEHIAIVPNSSVLVELFEKGILVFQYFELDDVAPDYYGFVRDSIARQVSSGDLVDAFWITDFYGADWLYRFRKYSPAADDSWRTSLPVLMGKIDSYLHAEHL
ncbi:hypothetical protein ACQKEK_03910 [Pseudomonas sp. NPDC077408]